MWELSQDANGLAPLIRDEFSKCIGILNGIDENIWNTKKDKYLIKNYDLRNFRKVRFEHKKWLCNRFNLDIKKPLIAFLGRFVFEKGADMLSEIILNSLHKAKQEVNYLILGKRFRID